MPSKAPDPMDTTLEGMVTVCRPEEAKALLLMFTRVWAEVRGKDPRDAVLAKA
jgi:glycogen debranching enzyme